MFQCSSKKKGVVRRDVYKRVGGEYTYIYGYPRKKVEHWNRCGQNQLLIGFQPVPVVGIFVASITSTSVSLLVIMNDIGK